MENKTGTSQLNTNAATVMQTFAYVDHLLPKLLETGRLCSTHTSKKDQEYLEECISLCEKISTYKETLGEMQPETQSQSSENLDNDWFAKTSSLGNMLSSEENLLLQYRNRVVSQFKAAIPVTFKNLITNWKTHISELVNQQGLNCVSDATHEIKHLESSWQEELKKNSSGSFGFFKKLKLLRLTKECDRHKSELEELNLYLVALKRRNAELCKHLVEYIDVLKIFLRVFDSQTEFGDKFYKKMVLLDVEKEVRRQIVLKNNQLTNLYEQNKKAIEQSKQVFANGNKERIQIEMNKKEQSMQLLLKTKGDPLQILFNSTKVQVDKAYTDISIHKRQLEQEISKSKQEKVKLFEDFSRLQEVLHDYQESNSKASQKLGVGKTLHNPSRTIRTRKKTSGI